MSRQGAVRWERAARLAPAGAALRPEQPAPAQPATQPTSPTTQPAAAVAPELPLVVVVPAVEVVDLHVTRARRPILRGLSFTVAPGTVTGVLGPAGAGKTTLLRCLVGAQRVTEGRALVLGLPAGARALRARVGYVPAAPAVYPDLDARANLRYFARVLRAPAERIERAVELVGLAGLRAAPAGALPPGELARLALATALLGEPELLALDEPTADLDPADRAELWDLLHRLAAAGATVLVSSHVSDEATRCSRLLALRAGALIADDTPAGLRSATGTGDLEEAFVRLAGARDEAGWAR